VTSTITASTILIGPTVSSFRLALGDDSAFKPGGNTLWTTTSDERLKRDIEPADLQRCYETLKSLPLRRYRWIDPARDQHRLGWIAQEVRPFFPQSVQSLPYHNLPDCLTLNPDQVYATMYGALQHLIQRQEALEQEIEALKANRMK
jgi:hypothetical protein